MHRIDGANHVAGAFSEGNPQTGTPATRFTADWTNAIQEEIAYIIEQHGLALNKASNTQLFAALLLRSFSTGDVKLTLKTAADAGWVMMNDGSIGSAGSGATTRANDDTAALFTLIWNNVANAWAPTQDNTGAPVARGASAGADWAAGRRIVLTKMLGRALAISGAGAGLTARALGETLGAETHALTANQNGQHTHSTGATRGAGAGAVALAAGTFDIVTVTGASGAGEPHNNMQPTSFLNAMVKL